MTQLKWIEMIKMTLQRKTTMTMVATMEVTCTLFFCVEFILKILGLGVMEYCADRWNQWDLLIVITSVIELCLSTPPFLNPLDIGGTHAKPWPPRTDEAGAGPILN